MDVGDRLRRLAPWLVGLAVLAIVPPGAWALQAYTARDGGQIRAAFASLGLALGAAAFAAGALWIRGRPPRRETGELIGPAAGVLLGVLLAGMSANTAGEPNLLFDWHYDGPPAPSPVGQLAALALPFVAAWRARLEAPGTRTALVVGLGFLVGVALSIAWLWVPGVGHVTDEFGFWVLYTLPSAVLGASAARWLPGRRLRRAFALAIGASFLSSIVWSWPVMTWMLGIPLVAVVAPAMAELSGPPAGDWPGRR